MRSVSAPDGPFDVFAGQGWEGCGEAVSPVPFPPWSRSWISMDWTPENADRKKGDNASCAVPSVIQQLDHGDRSPWQHSGHAAFTSIERGLAFSSFATCTVRIPSLNAAWTFSELASSGSVKLLMKLP